MPQGDSHRPRAHHAHAKAKRRARRAPGHETQPRACHGGSLSRHGAFKDTEERMEREKNVLDSRSGRMSGCAAGFGKGRRRPGEVVAGASPDRRAAPGCRGEGGGEPPTALGASWTERGKDSGRPRTASLAQHRSRTPATWSLGRPSTRPRPSSVSPASRPPRQAVLGRATKPPRLSTPPRRRAGWFEAQTADLSPCPFFFSFSKFIACINLLKPQMDSEKYKPSI